MDRRLAFVSALGLTLVLAATVVGVTAAQQAQDCRTIDDQQVCIQEMSAPGTLIVGGEEGELSVTIENVGSTEATPILMLYVEGPEGNETEQFELARPTLLPGETATVTQSLNATTPGTHRLQVGLIDEETVQQYHLSEVETVEVRTEPAPGLGGPIDRTEIALAALVLSLVGMAALAYRQFAS